MQARATLVEGGPPLALHLRTSTCGRQAGRRVWEDSRRSSSGAGGAAALPETVVFPDPRLDALGRRRVDQRSNAAELAWRGRLQTGSAIPAHLADAAGALGAAQSDVCARFIGHLQAAKALVDVC